MSRPGNGRAERAPLSPHASELTTADASMDDIIVPSGDIMDTFDMDIVPTGFDVDMGNADDQAHDHGSLPPSASSNATAKGNAYPLEQENTAEAPQSGSSTQSTGVSAITDFTRRRNWTQRVLEEMKDLLLILNDDGRILYASPSCKLITGREPEQVAGLFLSHFIHEDDKATFIREFNESIATGYPLRFHYRFEKNDGDFTIFEALGHPHMTSDKTMLGNGKEGNACAGFFLMCRPYLTKSSQLLDSFLEHKVENVRLTKRIEDLRKEEEQESKAHQQWLQKQDSHDPIAPGVEKRMLDDFLRSPLAHSADKGAMPPPTRPDTSKVGLSPHGLDEQNAISSSESISDRLAQIDSTSYVEGIEIMTGLYYGNGERSQGLSTGEINGRLIEGETDIASTDRQVRAVSIGDKKKKLKTSEEYVCTDCGTLASPEWRKGPNGPKTLCNACGLRWAKKEKKRQGSSQPPLSSAS